MDKVRIEWRSDLVPECDAWQDESGQWHGRHRGSGETFEADTFRALEVAACGVRIVATWREIWGPL